MKTKTKNFNYNKLDDIREIILLLEEINKKTVYSSFQWNCLSNIIGYLSRQI